MINTVLSGFDSNTKNLILDWKNNRNQRASNTLNSHPNLNPGATARYHFPSTDDALIQKVFDASFQQKRDQILQEAKNYPEQLAYPLWKRVCWIKIPRLIGSVLVHPATKVVVCLAMTCFGYFAAFRVYTAIAANTPLWIIQISDIAQEILQWNRFHHFLFLGGVGCILLAVAAPSTLQVCEQTGLFFSKIAESEERATCEQAAYQIFRQEFARA